MGSGLSAIERANAAAREYAAAWGDTVRSFEQGDGHEQAAVHMRRAGDQLVALVEGLRELHEQLDRPPIVPNVGQYGPDEVVRIVRAAVAFRQAAPLHKWPYQAWHEMAEICAAVDGKPGPEPGTRAAPYGMCDSWHVLTAEGAAACNVGLPGHQIDTERSMLAREVPAGMRCGTPGCRRQYARADRGDT